MMIQKYTVLACLLLTILIFTNCPGPSSPNNLNTQSSPTPSMKPTPSETPTPTPGCGQFTEHATVRACSEEEARQKIKAKAGELADGVCKKMDACKSPNPECKINHIILGDDFKCTPVDMSCPNGHTAGVECGVTVTYDCHCK